MQIPHKCVLLFTFGVVCSLPVIVQATDKTLKVGGRVQVDYTVADLNNPNVHIQGTEVRRARLNVSGQYGSQIKYKFEINKNTGDAINVEDAYIEFAPSKNPFKVKVGQFKTHNSLDEQTSSRFISTLERAAFTDAFSLDRRLGISASTKGDKYTFHAGVFSTNLEDGSSDSGYALAIRATFNPIKSDDSLVHMGVSWRYRNNSDMQSDLRYRQRPYTHVSSDRIVNTGRFSDSDNFFGVEAAVMYKHFWVAGEYGFLSANGSGTNADGNFGGFYGEIGGFWGGKRTYKGGKFNQPKIDNPVGEGGLGALSGVIRYDSIDLTNGVYAGELDTIVVGADWWPTSHTRLGVHFFDVDAESGVYDGGSGVVARVQFEF